jgi:hypothetical protein
VDNLPPFLVFAMCGAVVMTALLLASIVKTVRYHGWGQRTWAPPAVPWFIAAMVVGVLSLLITFLWPV